MSASTRPKRNRRSMEALGVSCPYCDASFMSQAQLDKHEEQCEIKLQMDAMQPPAPVQPLSDVVAFVEIRNDGVDAADPFSSVLRSLGAKIRKSFSQSCTHLIFKDGRSSILKRAQTAKACSVVKASWVEACQQNAAHVPEDEYIYDGLHTPQARPRSRDMRPSLSGSSGRKQRSKARPMARPSSSTPHRGPLCEDTQPMDLLSQPEFPANDQSVEEIPDSMDEADDIETPPVKPKTYGRKATATPSTAFDDAIAAAESEPRSKITKRMAGSANTSRSSSNSSDSQQSLPSTHNPRLTSVQCTTSTSTSPSVKPAVQEPQQQPSSSSDLGRPSSITESNARPETDQAVAKSSSRADETKATDRHSTNEQRPVALKKRSSTIEAAKLLVALTDRNKQPEAAGKAKFGRHPDHQCIVLALTGLTEEEHAIAEATCSQLSAVSTCCLSSKVTRKTTHVVSGGRRTEKVLAGLVHGCPIVTMEWLTASAENGCWLKDVTPYTHKAFQIPDRGLFKGKKFYVHPSCNTLPSQAAAWSKRLGAKVVKTRQDANIVIASQEVEGSVPMTWLFDCISKNSVLEHSDYIV
eukprot:TRINITY_DN12396_c0_g5_i2.p1 TRINITY_DN12396_c0_g5~~TRINITY_DN12396_c0_g5_i2.p1  ORF type:complete len:581 (+),score=69.43 TRINITY_DN12396_c0_g5_i2:113-1855(+)